MCVHAQVEPCHKDVITPMSYPLGIGSAQLCSLDAAHLVRSSSGDMNRRVQLSERAAAASGQYDITTKINQIARVRRCTVL